RLPADFLVMPGAIFVGMQRIAVATQSADRKSVVTQLLFERLQLRLVIEHRHLAMSIAGIISRPQFYGVDALRLQLLQNIFQRHLRQQRCKDSDFHPVSSLSTTSASIESPN